MLEPRWWRMGRGSMGHIGGLGKGRGAGPGSSGQDGAMRGKAGQDGVGYGRRQRTRAAASQAASNAD
eukprot:8482311-Lingulodinium_polyedra.AAC.1